MPIILQDLPFFDTPTRADFERGPVPIKAHQIMVWVGITEGPLTEFDPGRPCLPAILDTGHTHNFSIREDHLIRWAGLDPRSLENQGEVRISGDRVPLLYADVWLRPNVRGKHAIGSPTGSHSHWSSARASPSIPGLCPTRRDYPCWDCALRSRASI